MHVSLINVKAFFFSRIKVTFHTVTNFIPKCDDHSKNIKQKNLMFLVKPVYVK